MLGLIKFGFGQKKIFIESTSSFDKKTLIVEEDKYSIWCYILNENKIGIDFDGFLCSVTKPVKNKSDITKIINSGNPPPLLEKYANEFSHVKKIKPEDIKIEWKESSVEVFIKNELYLKMDLNNRISYSKSIKIKGPYGIPLK